jgi:hypothetical protein
LGYHSCWLANGLAGFLHELNEVRESFRGEQYAKAARIANFDVAEILDIPIDKLQE